MLSPLGMHSCALGCCAGSRTVRSCNDPVASQVPPSWDRASFLFLLFISPFQQPLGPPGVPAAQPYCRASFTFPPSPEDLCSHTYIWSTPKMLLGLSCKSFMKQCPDKSMVESSLLQALGQPSWTGDAQGYQTGKASGHVGCPMPSFAAPQSTGITAKACVALTGSLRII